MIFPVPDGNVIEVPPEVAVTEELPKAVVVGSVDVSPLVVLFAVPLAVPLMILVVEPLFVSLPDKEVVVPDADVSVATDEEALVALPKPDVESPVAAEDEAGVEEPVDTHIV